MNKMLIIGSILTTLSTWSPTISNHIHPDPIVSSAYKIAPVPECYLRGTLPADRKVCVGMKA